MNKIDLISESYKNYLTMTEPTFIGKNISLPEYIHRIKTDDKFSQKWGLKIVERELSLEERKEILYSKFRKEPIVVNGKSYIECAPTDINFEFFNIPTKLITITYNNETIESYE